MNAVSLINDVRDYKADSVNMSGERNLIAARFEEHVRVRQALVNVNAERNVTLKGDIVTVRELFESGRNIGKSENSVKILKLTQQVRRRVGCAKSKPLELQTMPRFVEEASSVWEEFSMAKVEIHRLFLGTRMCSR